MIPLPHGGALVERPMRAAFDAEAAERLRGAPRLTVSDERIMDAANIARGVMSPLQGFIGKEALDALTGGLALTDGTPWGLPVLLDVNADTARTVEAGGPCVLTNADGSAHIEVHVRNVFAWDKRQVARGIFETDSEQHPGVAMYAAKGEYLIEAEVRELFGVHVPIPAHSLSPKQTRTLFDGRGLRSVAGFQTRNAPHRGHERLHKMATALVDAVLIQPVIGKKKPGDFTDDAIVAAHKALLKSYYVPKRAILATLPLEMHYAGPREAVHHAIIRKNFGCTHFIVGRDHAGVGNFYEPEAAINIFTALPDLGITILTFRGDFAYCTTCDDIVSDRTCPHAEGEHISFSGTTVREALARGDEVDARLMRPEVASALSAVAPMFVE